MNKSACLIVVLGWGFLLSGVVTADKLDFEPVPEFVKLPEAVSLDACSGIAVNSAGEVYLLHRGTDPVIVLDPRGRFLRSWGGAQIGKPHALRIDRDDHVWITDIGNHQVLKFNGTGKLILALGKSGQAGEGQDEFNKPTDVAFGSRGEIYVSDGYGNNRIVKLTPNGGFLSQWGTAGDGPGMFNVPHTIVVNRQGHIVVGDRENDRVQIFDEVGKLLHIWPGFAPFGLTYDRQGNLFVADGRANKVLQLNDRGKIIGSWGGEGAEPGQFQLPHMLASDAEGNLLVGEIAGKRFQKLKRQP